MEASPPVPHVAPGDAFLRLPSVSAKVGLTKSEIYRRMRAGTFPRNYPYRRAAQQRFWLLSELEEWMAEELDHASGRYSEDVEELIGGGED